MIKRGLALVFVLVFLVGFSFITSDEDDPWDVREEVDFENIGVLCQADLDFARWVNVTIDQQTQLLGDIFTNNSNQDVSCAAPSSLEDSWTKSSCCPTGYSCNVDTGDCESDPIDFCNRFKTKTTCESNEAIEAGEKTIQLLYPEKFPEICRDLIDMKTISLGGGNFFQRMNKCGCVWNGSESDGICEAYNSVINATFIDGDYSENYLNRCRISHVETINNCDQHSRQIIMKYRSTLINGTDSEFCSDPNDRVFACDAVVVVPFFTFANFLISTLVISLVYFIYTRKFLK